MLLFAVQMCVSTEIVLEQPTICSGERCQERSAAWHRAGPHQDISSTPHMEHFSVELETKAIRRFAKVSIVSYSRLSLMIIASASQFQVYLPLGQRPFSIVS